MVALINKIFSFLKKNEEKIEIKIPIQKLFIPQLPELELNNDSINSMYEMLETANHKIETNENTNVTDECNISLDEFESLKSQLGY